MITLEKSINAYNEIFQTLEKHKDVYREELVRRRIIALKSELEGLENL
jgi:hypothetical protein